MSKKSIKIISAILLAVILIFSVSNMVFALAPNEIQGTAVTNETGITTVGNRIVGALKVIGAVAAVIMLMIIGLKYMMGSAEEKADYKKALIPYIVGAILIFMAPQIAGFVFSAVTGNA